MFPIHRLVLGGVVAAFASTTTAFYLPGAAPRDYRDGEKVELFVNALTPMLASTENAKLVRGPVID